jgi:uncharacterized protein YlxW (UPF0749 family)
MSPAKKPRNYRATDATMINTAATRKREASLAARVRRLEERVAELAKRVRDTSTSLAKAPRR